MGTSHSRFWNFARITTRPASRHKTVEAPTQAGGPEVEPLERQVRRRVCLEEPVPHSTDDLPENP